MDCTTDLDLPDQHNSQITNHCNLFEAPTEYSIQIQKFKFNSKILYYFQILFKLYMDTIITIIILYNKVVTKQEKKDKVT